MARRPVGYGLWPSTIAARDVAAGARRFGMLAGDGPWLYWTEGRPEEKGRQTIMRAKAGVRAAPKEVLPAPFSARSRVHEYGGGELLATAGRIFFVNDADQDIYEMPPEGGVPRRITNAQDMRFADMCLDAERGRLLAVGERHGKGHGRVENLIVAVALEGSRAGSVSTLVSGRDFYAAPRLSPDGRRIAFVTWDLPGMPWDSAELVVAELDARGAPQQQMVVAGGGDSSASHPAWAPDGRLIHISDASGFGSLMAFDGTVAKRLSRGKLEYGRPPWVFGAYPFAIDGEGTVWAAPIASAFEDGDGCRVLAVAQGGKASWHTIAASGVDSLVALDGGFGALVSSPTRPLAVTAFATRPDSEPTLHRAASDSKLHAQDVAAPRLVHFPGGDGRRTFALYYAPTNRKMQETSGELPPAIVMAHGGPTASADRGLKLRTQFYTSRGFAVLDVDYAGSTGYGRAYRERLDGRWGLDDVADCAAGAKYLVRKGLADSQRIAIAGGSAGGYTVLMALATTDVFAAGSSHYGISDLTLLMEHTHKFEAGYLHRLLGTTDRAWKKVCRERSPIQHIDTMTAPVILFQGLDDKVVPPEQSRLIHESLKARGIATELHEFAGEGHGFRRSDTIIAVLEAELDFLVRTLGLGREA